MDTDGSLASHATATAGKKRTPKSCSSCRRAKTQCNLQQPCARCEKLSKECVYAKRPKTAADLRIEELEHEVAALKSQRSLTEPGPSVDTTSPFSTTSITQASPQNIAGQSLKRKRAHFSISKEVTIPDFITKGMISQEDAFVAWQHFFQGCDRFVPIFDAADTFQSVWNRSSLLFNVIVAVGCGVASSGTVDARVLHVHLKRWLTTIILSASTPSLETIQSLLIMACWMPERSLILAIACRMAVETGIDQSFDDLVRLSIGSPPLPTDSSLLMKRTRVWFVLVNLERILEVDAGNLLGLKVTGIRRCRALLDRPFSTQLDTRLFSQLELNHLRSKINENLLCSADDLAQAVQDARIDIDVWYTDWKRIMQTSALSGEELPSLLANLKVQKYWAEATAACRAIHVSGVHNIDMMSSEQKDMLRAAKDSLHLHLDTMLVQRAYLSNIRYAMDFVWAKCAFSFLLLLKLTILLPESIHHNLLSKGMALYSELSKAVLDHGTSRVYLKLLKTSLDKYEARQAAATADFEQFVPEEFVFDWDFYGLALFSSPLGWDVLFDQHVLGDDFFSGVQSM